MKDMTVITGPKYTPSHQDAVFMRKCIAERQAEITPALAGRIRSIFDPARFPLDQDRTLALGYHFNTLNLVCYPGSIGHFSDLMKLASHVFDYPRLGEDIHRILPKKDRPEFTKMLEYWRDKRNPRFDLSATIAQLFPVARIAEMMRLDPGLFYMDAVIESCWSIDHLSPNLRHPAFKNNVASFGVTCSYGYKNVGISHVNLDDSLQDQGLGRYWYLNLIEPYLRSCGFAKAIVSDDCYNSAGGFWDNMGFEWEGENDTFDGEEVIRYTGRKDLQR